MSGLVRAILFPDLGAFQRQRVPGSIHLVAHTEPRLAWLWAFCPCGCGLSTAVLLTSSDGDPLAADALGWNGSRTDPTIIDPVLLLGHWQGQMRHGYWSAA